MPTMTQPLSSMLDPWDRINAWPANKPLKSTEAAIFLRMSDATLQRMRASGSGPHYVQAGVKRKAGDPPLGTNQQVLYFKEDIEAWYRENKVKSTGQAAVKKGQTFATLFDLVEDAAFYVDSLGAVESMVEENTMAELVERLGVWDIVWMPVVEAASRRWSDLIAHREFASHVRRVLSDAQSRVEQSVEATDIATGLAEGKPNPVPSIDD